MTGHVGLPAILMAGIIFLWTPPHFWALSLYRREDYERAGLPMLPVTHGEPYTRRAILVYSIVLVTVTLLAGPWAGFGMLYTAAAEASALMNKHDDRSQNQSHSIINF